MTSAPPPRHLVIFAKAPRLGAVKSRLARDVGQVEAWRFQTRILTVVTRRLGQDRRWTCWLALTPNRAVLVSWPWLRRSRCRLLAQGDGDLGARMARILRTLPPGPAVIVGSDIPELAPPHIARALAALGAHDVVLGPATDGGYWLVGARGRSRLSNLFQAVRWSTPHALADTLANMPRGRSVVLLETLADVDDGQGLARWRAGNSGIP